MNITSSKRTLRTTPIGAARQPQRRTINAGTSITSGVQNRRQPQFRIGANYAGLTPLQRSFAEQLSQNCRRHSSIMGATNTTNIAARPDFMEMLPIFVQKLLILDVFGSVAMNSRIQTIPYIKFIAENTKGETKKGDILASPLINRQGLDENFTGRVIKNEIVESAAGTFKEGQLGYGPVLPGTVTVTANLAGISTPYTDDGIGNLLDNTGEAVGTIAYDMRTIIFDDPIDIADGDTVKCTYQYDNENVGPDPNGNYGAQMGKGYLQWDEFDMKAEAHELACYWSVFSAFAAQKEWGTNVAEMTKDAAFGELTAEINTKGFRELEKAALYKPQFNWDAAPMQSSVMPSDYINTIKLKFDQAAASIYQATRLARPNRLIVGTNVATYIGMAQGFSFDSIGETVGPYKLGKLGPFEVYVEPNYDPNKWVMACKSSDISRNSALFGEYMPFTDTQAIGLANASVQQGYVTMYAMKVVNPATVCSGKIVGIY